MRARGGGASDVARTGIAIAIASLAGYALLAIVGRSLDPSEFGLFVAFWGVLFGLGSSLSTIEQEVARQAAIRSSPATGAPGTGSTLPGHPPEGAAPLAPAVSAPVAVADVPGPPASAVTAAAAVLAALSAAVTLVPSVGHRLYGETNSWTGVVVLVAALGFAVQFAVRGLLIGSRDVHGYAWLVVVEAAARLVVLLGVLALVGLDLRTAAVAVGVGSFGWLFWARRARAVLPSRRLPRATWFAAAGRASSLMLGAALIASVITGFPTLVTVLTDGTPGAAGGAVFAALTVSRIPLLLISPVQALAVPFVVRARQSAGPDGTSMLRRGLLLGTAAALLLGALGAAVAWAVGPWAVGLVYGEAYDVPAAAIAVLVLSACLLAWTQLLSAALIALSAHRRMIIMWAVAVAATIGWLVLSPFDVVVTTAVGSLAGPVAALLCALPMVAGLARVGDPAPR